jgi:hypothetical protein
MIEGVTGRSGGAGEVGPPSFPSIQHNPEALICYCDECANRRQQRKIDERPRNTQGDDLAP